MDGAARSEQLRQKSPHLQSTNPLSPEMLHQVWAALLYLYGLLFNSMYQCPEHSQLAALGVDEKEVRTEDRESLYWKPKLRVGS